MVGEVDKYPGNFLTCQQSAIAAGIQFATTYTFINLK
jgi:hypothetical protein